MHGSSGTVPKRANEVVADAADELDESGEADNAAAPRARDCVFINLEAAEVDDHDDDDGEDEQKRHNLCKGVRVRQKIEEKMQDIEVYCSVEHSDAAHHEIQQQKYPARVTQNGSHLSHRRVFCAFSVCILRASPVQFCTSLGLDVKHRGMRDAEAVAAAAAATAQRCPPVALLAVQPPASMSASTLSSTPAAMPPRAAVASAARGVELTLERFVALTARHDEHGRLHSRRRGTARPCSARAETCRRHQCQ